MLKSIDCNITISYAAIRRVLTALRGLLSDAHRRGEAYLSHRLLSVTGSRANEQLCPQLAGACIDIHVPTSPSDISPDNHLPRYVELSWTSTDGCRHRERVGIVTKLSNLGRGFRGWLVCPMSQQLCISLYTDGQCLACRDVLQRNGCMYACQRRSRKLRTLRGVEEAREKWLHALSRCNSYAGKPTKWDRRRKRRHDRYLRYAWAESAVLERFENRLMRMFPESTERIIRNRFNHMMLLRRMSRDR